MALLLPLGDPYGTTRFQTFLENSIPYLTGIGLGLATHAAAATPYCTSIIDVLVATKVPLVDLFGGEHELRGEAAADDSALDYIGF